jgi:hypothetical protein
MLDMGTRFKCRQQNCLLCFCSLEHGHLCQGFRYSCFTQLLLVGRNILFHAEGKLCLNFSLFLTMCMQF